VDGLSAGQRGVSEEAEWRGRLYGGLSAPEAAALPMAVTVGSMWKQTVSLASNLV